MYTIRQAVNYYYETKATNFEMDIADAIKTTSLCFIIKLNNGISIFINMNQYDEYVTLKPNKNGVFKKFLFEFYGNTKPVIPEIMKGSISKLHSFDNGVHFETTQPIKERVMNEFISLNGGINEEYFKESINKLWESLI